MGKRGGGGGGGGGGGSGSATGFQNSRKRTPSAEVHYDSNGDPFHYRKTRPSDSELPLGTQVRMLFDDGVYYKGRIDIYNDVTKQYRIAFEDGDKIYVKLPDEDVQIAVPIWKKMQDEGRVAKKPKFALFTSGVVSEAALTALTQQETVQSRTDWEDRAPDAPESVLLVPQVDDNTPRHLQIAAPLLQVLTDDWLQVAHDGLLYQLPFPPDWSVAALLRAYGEKKPEAARPAAGKEFGRAPSGTATGGEADGGITSEMRKAFALELTACFDTVLRDSLLYRPDELAQHTELVAKRKVAGHEAQAGGGGWAEVYGAPHLARLVSKLHEVCMLVKGHTRLELVKMANDFASFFAAECAVKATRGPCA